MRIICLISVQLDKCIKRTQLWRCGGLKVPPRRWSRQTWPECRWSLTGTFPRVLTYAGSAAPTRHASSPSQTVLHHSPWLCCIQSRPRNVTSQLVHLKITSLPSCAVIPPPTALLFSSLLLFRTKFKSATMKNNVYFDRQPEWVFITLISKLTVLFQQTTVQRVTNRIKNQSFCSLQSSR